MTLSSVVKPYHQQRSAIQDHKQNLPDQSLGGLLFRGGKTSA